MQIIVTMKSDGRLSIPLNYEYQLQSAIYKKLQEVNMSDFWHDYGFGENKKFKSFCFGPLQGKHVVNGKQITFLEDVSFEIRSIYFGFCDAFQRSLENNPVINLFHYKLQVTNASLCNYHCKNESVHFKAVSPVIVDIHCEDGSTRFFDPKETEFKEGLEKNYLRKYYAMYNESPPEVSILPLGNHKEIITNYKDIWYVGYKGEYLIQGPINGIEFIYNTGLGIKNAAGFGLIKEVCYRNPK